MALIDWVIVAILLVSVLGAAKRGFFVEAFSLAGIILGLLLASWNYQKAVPWLSSWIHPLGLAQALSFLAIALAVMIVAGLIGRVVRWSVHSIGLGWVDRIIGAAFGFGKGCVLVTLGMMAIAAFTPGSTWFRQSRLAPYFLSAAHQMAVVTPAELGERIRQGVNIIREAQPDWLKPSPRQLDHNIEPGTNRA